MENKLSFWDCVGILTVIFLLLSPALALDSFSFTASDYIIKDSFLNNTPSKELTLSLAKDLNLSNLGLKESNFLNLTIQKLYGDADIKLYLKEIVNINKTNYYQCNCTITEIKSNKTNVTNCLECVSFTLVPLVKYTEINLSNLTNLILKKNATIVEVPVIKKIVKLPKGYGYSVYSDINLLGLNIKNMTWWNTSFQNRYVLVGHNDGSKRNNELTFFLNVTDLGYNYANHTDLIVALNDTYIIPYQFMNNKTQIAFRVNSSNATIYGYTIYTNSTSTVQYQNTTFIDIFQYGDFEASEGYINGNSVNGINNWSTSINCNGAGRTANERVNSSGAYRGSYGLAIIAGDFFFMPSKWGSTTSYFTAYMKKSTANALQTTYFSYSGGRLIGALMYGSPNADSLTWWDSAQNEYGSNPSNDWMAVNAVLVSNSNSLINVTNSSGGLMSLTKNAYSSQSTLYDSCLSNFGAGGLSLYDKLYVATSEINQYLNYTEWTYTYEPQESVPVITFLNQTPAFITPITLFNGRLNISYSISDTDSTPVNNSTVQIYYKINTTTQDGAIYINGTLLTGYENTSYDSASGSVYNFSLGDSKVYPASYNIEQQYMQQTAKINYALSGSNHYIFQEVLNITPSNLTVVELYAIPPATASTLQIWICNQSKVANIQTSNSCFLLCNILNTQSYNHTHTANSKHYVCSYSVNSTNQTHNVKVNPTMYIYARPSNNQVWYIEYISNTSRVNATMYTTNSGTAYSQLSGTTDSHFHFYNGNETAYYKVCANDTVPSQTCSSERNITINTTIYPPSTPFVYIPNSSVVYYKNTTVPIFYTNATTFDNSTLTYYNISLLSSSLGYLATIVANNGLNTNYSANLSAIANGYYIIRVEICNTNNLCSQGYSELFRLQSPFVLNPNKREIVKCIKEIVSI